MDIGMLWFDDGPGAVKDKVARAGQFYAEKYGRVATVCMVHPNTLRGWEGKVGGIEVMAEKAILPDHYWIGVEESAADGRGEAANGRLPSGRTAKSKRRAAGDIAETRAAA